MNNVRPEGVSKFRLTLKRAPAPEQVQVIALEKWRALFYKLGLVGEYPNEKIGYGNLSSRLPRKAFLMTGSQTGHLAHLQSHHYTKVIECDLKKGSVTAEGLIPPPGESLTHFGIYEANGMIQNVFHVHHPNFWMLAQNANIDSVNRQIQYGTQEMAGFLNHLLSHKSSGLIALKEQSDGIISYGTSAEDAGKNILDLYRKLAVRQ